MLSCLTNAQSPIPVGSLPLHLEKASGHLSTQPQRFPWPFRCSALCSPIQYPFGKSCGVPLGNDSSYKKLSKKSDSYSSQPVASEPTFAPRFISKSSKIGHSIIFEYLFDIARLHLQMTWVDCKTCNMPCGKVSNQLHTAQPEAHRLLGKCTSLCMR